MTAIPAVRAARGGLSGRKIQAIVIGVVILVTHNPDLAARYTQRVIQIADGRLISGDLTGAWR